MPETKPRITLLYKTLKNIRFTTAVMLSLIVIYLLGLFIPQKAQFATAVQYRAWQDESVLHALLVTLRLTEIYTAPLTMFLLGLFFLNLAVVTIDRVPLVLRRAFLSGGAPKLDPMRIKGSASTVTFGVPAPAHAVIVGVDRFFRHQRWTLISGALTGTRIAVRNRFSSFGFLFFHGSFVLCLVGGLLLAYTRFSCTLGVAEGETFHGRLDQAGTVTKRSLLFQTMPEMSLNVNRIKARYEEGASSDLSIDVDSVIDGVARKERIKINEPLTQGAISVVAQNIGLAPLVVVATPAGAVIDTVFAKLDVLNGRGDSFKLGSKNQYLVTVRYFPDYVVYNGAETSRSPEPRNPAFHLVITREGAPIFDGTVRLGEEAEMDGLRISFKELHYWAYFKVIREYGQWPLIAGFALASLGLIMRLIFYQKRILLLIEEQDGQSLVYLQGQAEFFTHSFLDEMTLLAEKLRRELKREI